MEFKNIKLVVFDLDGTLAESKSPMDREMAGLLENLLEKKMVAIISGGTFEQFQKQLLVLRCKEELLVNLFFFPVSGTRFYRYENGWKQIYANEMTVAERQKIKKGFEQAFRDINYEHPPQLYGEVLEDRGSQITFSALGQQAPLNLKKQWHDTNDRRKEIVAALVKYIPEFEVKIPGVTSIDVTRKGIDKGYGVEQMQKMLGVSAAQMVFVGDALYEGGNDYPVRRTGVECVAVKSIEETKAVVRKWLTGI